MKHSSARSAQRRKAPRGVLRETNQLLRALLSQLSGPSSPASVPRPPACVLAEVLHKGFLYVLVRGWPDAGEPRPSGARGPRSLRKAMTALLRNLVERVEETPWIGTALRGLERCKDLVLADIEQDGFHYALVRRTPTRDSLVTGRQLAILDLVAEGLPSKTISDRLGMAEVTVETHILRLRSRFGCPSRAALVAEVARLA